VIEPLHFLGLLQLEQSVVICKKKGGVVAVCSSLLGLLVNKDMIAVSVGFLTGIWFCPSEVLAGLMSHH